MVSRGRSRRACRATSHRAPIVGLALEEATDLAGHRTLHDRLRSGLSTSSSGSQRRTMPRPAQVGQEPWCELNENMARAEGLGHRAAVLDADAITRQPERLALDSRMKAQRPSPQLQASGKASSARLPGLALDDDAIHDEVDALGLRDSRRQLLVEAQLLAVDENAHPALLHADAVRGSSRRPGGLLQSPRSHAEVDLEKSGATMRPRSPSRATLRVELPDVARPSAHAFKRPRCSPDSAGLPTRA